ncbi:ankyrin repeat domain-containing protein [Flavobacterium zepuense]|uniref:Ankyrin repeat domain-containing protein n=1 Tax=Flavobacterium zepuense TaxID=2593302 RepID=A0A552UT89_9FLAO|nr:ankyrin repeat domain-containing protein [Flavobacterium zepuense]TRW21438.1 ankyrin repeat domain-containing protein [Flavobacterium zepuense]
MSLLKKLFGSASKDKAIDIDINTLDDYKRNALFGAIINGNEAAAINLINRGIALNAQDSNGQTPLHFCALYSNYNIARAILDKGTDVNLKDNYGNTPLWTAVFNGQKSKDYGIVKLLLSHGADAHSINNVNKTPLDFARQVGYTDLIKILEGKLI